MTMTDTQSNALTLAKSALNHGDPNATAAAAAKPVIYACSGCSDAGELADRVARQLSREGFGEMSCLAGIGGRVKPLLLKGQRAQRIIVVDGCPLNCARHTLRLANLTNIEHVQLHELGHRKGNCAVTDERVREAAVAAKQQLQSASIDTGQG
jgi:uncharacterized metal-binding protein